MKTILFEIREICGDQITGCVFAETIEEAVDKFLKTSKLQLKYVDKVKGTTGWDKWHGVFKTKDGRLFTAIPRPPER